MYQIELIASKTDSSQEVMLKILVDIANRLGIKRPVTIRKKIWTKVVLMYSNQLNTIYSLKP